MYIGYNLIQKEGILKVMDELDFTFGIKPESIPYLYNKYGCSINATKFSLRDVATIEVRKTMNNLNDPELKLESVTTDNRDINVGLKYNGKQLAIKNLVYSIT